jgi:endonuclease/exonuclease/phosphatase family metal-dependent hydrolase
MKLISLNVWGDHCTQEQIEFFQKERPDVLCMQEVYEVDLPLYETALGMKGTFVALTSIDHPHPYGDALRGPWGIAIFSTYPLTNIHHAFYQYTSAKDSLFPHTGAPDTCARALVWADTTIGEETFTIATTHFTWTSTADVSPVQKEAFVNLQQILKTIPQFILTGDFNTPRGKEIFDTLATDYIDAIPASVESTLDPVFHRTQGKVKLVIDVLFTTPQYVAKNVHIITGVSDHVAIVGSIEKTH